MLASCGRALAALPAAGCAAAVGRLGSSILRCYGAGPDPAAKRHDDDMHAYLDKLFCLRGRVAFITGAAGGVGNALCLALAK